MKLKKETCLWDWTRLCSGLTSQQVCRRRLSSSCLLLNTLPVVCSGVSERSTSVWLSAADRCLHAFWLLVSACRAETWAYRSTSAAAWRSFVLVFKLDENSGFKRHVFLIKVKGKKKKKWRLQRNASSPVFRKSNTVMDHLMKKRFKNTFRSVSIHTLHSAFRQLGCFVVSSTPGEKQQLWWNLVFVWASV